MKIIVVDDEINSLHLFLDQIIANDDVEYKFFKDDPSLVLSYVKNNSVDGAFLDINMPNISGIELAKKILDISKKIKICFITGLNVTVDNLDESIKNNVLGIIYKPVSVLKLEHFISLMRNESSLIEVKTFGTFDCFVNGRLVKFTSSKAKELFALLVVNRGKSITMEQVITYLWPDKQIDKAKILYRDAVWRLRNTLQENSIDCVEFSRASLALKNKNIRCDYYDLLDGKDVYYPGEFLLSYEWSLPYESEIDYLIENKN